MTDKINEPIVSCGANAQKDIVVKAAECSDIPKIVGLLSHVANESDSDYEFDESHAWEHVSGIICNGVSFVTVVGRKVTGVLMCSHVDLAFTQTKDLETQHLYVLPEARTTRATAKLLDAIEAYADENQIVVIFHQMDYISALTGSPNNSRRVERLFQSRNYEGPVDTATVGEPERRVGVSYRYVGKHSDQVI